MPLSPTAHIDVADAAHNDVRSAGCRFGERGSPAFQRETGCAPSHRSPDGLSHDGAPGNGGGTEVQAVPSQWFSATPSPAHTSFAARPVKKSPTGTGPGVVVHAVPSQCAPAGFGGLMIVFVTERVPAAQMSELELHHS